MTDAERLFEAIDIENDEYVFFANYGTVIDPNVRAGWVVPTPTVQVRANELRDRIRTYLSQLGKSCSRRLPMTLWRGAGY